MEARREVEGMSDMEGRREMEGMGESEMELPLCCS